MKLRYLILVMIMGLCSTSCEDFLDTEPTNFIAPTYSTLSELETALVGVYDVLGSLHMYGDAVPYWLNMGTDEAISRHGTPNTTAFIFSPADDRITGFWRTLYIGIYRANLVLAKVDNPDLDEVERNNIKGQALFLRAYYYFMLVRNFGGVPLLLTDKPDINNVDVPKSSIAEVYEIIVRDMTEAEGIVKPVQEGMGGGRITQSAVQGILARVHLTMAGYPLNDQSQYAEALKWAKKVRDSGLHALNPSYEDIFIRYARDEYDIKESIWEVEHYGLQSEGDGEYSYWVGYRIGVRNTEDVELGISPYVVSATGYLYDLYEIDPNTAADPITTALDLRREWNIANFYYEGNPGVKTYYVPDASGVWKWRLPGTKWRREYEVLKPKDRNYTAQNFPLLRYSDVLLMLAEAEYNVNGATPEAYEAINEVRRRGYGLLLPNPPNPGVDADLPEDIDFMQAIKEERARELCFEGERRLDLIRWGNFVSYMKEYRNWALANGALAGHVLGPANVSQRETLLPIPTAELALNKALTQNPGY